MHLHQGRSNTGGFSFLSISFFFPFLASTRGNAAMHHTARQEDRSRIPATLLSPSFVLLIGKKWHGEAFLTTIPPFCGNASGPQTAFTSKFPYIPFSLGFSSVLRMMLRPLTMDILPTSWYDDFYAAMTRFRLDVERHCFSRKDRSDELSAGLFRS